MKRILIFIILFSALFAGQIKMTETCQVRDSSDWRTSKQVGVIEKGTIIEYTDTFGDWAECDVIKGDSKENTSDHIGKKGFFWTQEIGSLKEGKTFIKNEGLTLRSSPEKVPDKTPADTSDDSNFIAKVKAGSAIYVKKLVVTWYEIGPNRWVSFTYAEEQ